jgi:undecaprenyl-diphosphatase
MAADPSTAPGRAGVVTWVAAQSASESYWLAFLVGLHVATALALLFYYRATWARLLAAGVRTLRTRRIETPDERLI